MSAVSEVVDQLRPALEQLVEYLEASKQPQALEFFRSLQQRMQLPLVCIFVFPPRPAFPAHRT